MPPLSYTNRKGETKYLRAVQASKGGTRYYLVNDPAQYPPDELVNEMPAGFEWYEYPHDGKIVWRKHKPSTITAAEHALVLTTARAHSPYPDLYLDTEPKQLVLYFCRDTPESWGIDEAWFVRHKWYDAVLIFAKLPADRWQVQRECHHPGFPEWIPLETSPDLAVLAAKYTPHIGQESLLDFWIEGKPDF
ncbi:hypothetical protein EJV47_20500 [Hymenobacter gummosus]|uniref:Uncharacterized protein n=1 Tax=Hymenobacter gummosus TaxID=1776032 RepID=A0A431TYE0_9BACT|nr:hypothetical protein [Hymenobacter gummosus]RTQ46758.1 hypothetical protein EJV47_20500 [Hymenobacter gummosus]